MYLGFIIFYSTRTVWRYLAILPVLLGIRVLYINVKRYIKKKRHHNSEQLLLKVEQQYVAYPQPYVVVQPQQIRQPQYVMAPPPPPPLPLPPQQQQPPGNFNYPKIEDWNNQGQQQNGYSLQQPHQQQQVNGYQQQTQPYN